MNRSIFTCDLCGNQMESYSEENKFYTDKVSFILICDGCLSVRKCTCRNCCKDRNLVYIHYTNNSLCDTVSCKECMYDVSDEIEENHADENIGDCQFCDYFPESVLDNKSFMENFHNLLEHQCH